MDFCWSKDCKAERCQSWKSENSPTAQPESNQIGAARVGVLDDGIIHKV